MLQLLTRIKMLLMIWLVSLLLLWWTILALTSLHLPPPHLLIFVTGRSWCRCNKLSTTSRYLLFYPFLHSHTLFYYYYCYYSLYISQLLYMHLCRRRVFITFLLSFFSVSLFPLYDHFTHIHLLMLYSSPPLSLPPFLYVSYPSNTLLNYVILFGVDCKVRLAYHFK